MKAQLRSKSWYLFLSDAVALKHWIELSKDDMRKMRSYLKKFDVAFPTTTDTLKFRKGLYPSSLNVFLNGDAVRVDYRQLIVSTTESVLQIAAETEAIDTLQASTLTMYFKDGAGGQKIWYNSKAMTSETETHLYQYGVVPLRLESTMNGETRNIWKNPSPNSAQSLRPYCIARREETNSELLQHVVKDSDAAKTTLTEGFVASYCCTGDVIAVDIQVVIIDSMKDIKYKKNLSGLGGADCLLCKTKQDQWLMLENVQQGFPINRSASENMQLWIALSLNGEIQKESGDFNQRKGLTQMPLTISDQRSITITHSYINGTRWFIKFLSRVLAKALKWSFPKASRQFKLIEFQKERILKIIQSKTGLTLERLNKGGRSGTTTTGNAGRRFFSSELAPTLQELVDDTNTRSDVLSLHRKISAVLRIISCDRKIDLDEYSRLVTKIGVILAEKFSWAKLNFTLHASLHHSAELIKDNNSQGLGSLSEEALDLSRTIKIFGVSWKRCQGSLMVVHK